MLTASVSERKTPYIQHKKKKNRKKRNDTTMGVHSYCVFLFGINTCLNGNIGIMFTIQVLLELETEVCNFTAGLL